MDRFLCTISIFYLCKTDTPNFSWEKKEKRLDYKEKLSFFKKFFSFSTLFLQSSYFYNFFFSHHIYAMQCLSHSVAVSFPKKVISIGISNPTPIRLFTLVPVTLQVAYDPGKRRNLFNVLLRKRDTCPTTASRLK